MLNHKQSRSRIETVTRSAVQMLSHRTNHVINPPLDKFNSEQHQMELR